jgi:Zn-dependent oligopeptidase
LENQVEKLKRTKRQLEEKNKISERHQRALEDETESFKREKYVLMNKIIELKSELGDVKEQAARNQVFSR